MTTSTAAPTTWRGGTSPRSRARVEEDELGPHVPFGALAVWIRTVNGSLARALTIKVSDDGRERRTAKAYLGALMPVC